MSTVTGVVYQLYQLSPTPKQPGVTDDPLTDAFAESWNPLYIHRVPKKTKPSNFGSKLVKS